MQAELSPPESASDDEPALETSEPAPEPYEIKVEVGGEAHTVSSAMFRGGASLEECFRIVDLYGRACEQQVLVDAHYRTERAKMVLSIRKAHPKLPEWRIKADIEATEWFGSVMRDRAIAEKVVNTLRALLSANVS